MKHIASEVATDAQDAFVLSFGKFFLRFPQRELSCDDIEVRLGSRATDILVALVQNAGELVSHDELIAAVWGETIVEESALRVHMSALRKALGDGKDGARYIINETGRGYRFVASVNRSSVQHNLPAVSPGGRKYRLPAALSRVIGREDIVEGLSSLIPERRFLTIAGPGGIGKTTVALAVVHAFVANHGAEACFVDFAPVLDPGVVGSTIALALGVPVSKEDPVSELVDALTDRSVLLLLDNCEHLVDPIASLIERLLQGSPALRILATSREPFRAEGEWVHRLATLQLPPDDQIPALSDALAFASVQLFVERASALRHTFALSDANVAAVCDICRRLDGIPLALEFAAARVDVMDVQSIAARLGDRFAFLTKGRRTALPRQQTLRAVFDWSYELLDPLSQIVLQRLSVFRSRFDMVAAVAICTSDGIDELGVLEATTDLVAKSLISTETSAGETRYWLLDTTRQYGLARLAASQAIGAAKRRHALHCCTIFADPTAAWEGKVARDRITLNSHHLDDIRAALDWAFSPDGDAVLGVELVITTTNLWFHMSLPNELIVQTQKAIALVEASDLRDSMQHWALMATYALTLWHLRGPIPDMPEAFDRALAIAEKLGSPTLRKRSVWGTWAGTIVFGDYAESLAAADKFCAMPDESDEMTNLQIGRRIRSMSLHFMGQHAMARDLTEEYMRTDALLDRSVRSNHAQVDGQIAAQSLHMRTLWLQGHTQEAIDCARACAEEALAMDHDLSISFALGMGVIPVALWAGDTALANQYMPVLRSRTSGRGLAHGASWADGFEGAMSGTSNVPPDTGVMQLELFATIGSASALERLLQEGRQEVTTWAQPEILRLAASRIAKADRATADEMRKRALSIAVAQGAIAWKSKIINDMQ